MDETPDTPEDAAADPSGPAAAPAPGSIGDERTRRALAADPGAATPTLPGTGARVAAFVAVLAAGAAGGFIGYAVTDLQCSGECSVATGIGGLVGAVIGAVGVAIVVQLALKAMSEWRTMQAREGGAPPPKRTDRIAPSGERRPRPRVQ